MPIISKGWRPWDDSNSSDAPPTSHKKPTAVPTPAKSFKQVPARCVVQKTSQAQWDEACATYENRMRIQAGGSGLNHNKAESVVSLDGDRERHIASIASLIISKVAEDLTGYPQDGDDEWDMDRLMYRRLSKVPLKSCRMERERESILFIIDTSPSCGYMARFYARMVSSLVDRGDVELIKAPNAFPTVFYDRREGKWQSFFSSADEAYDTEDAHYYRLQKDPSYDGWSERWQGRTAIFFGDFDGQLAVERASERMKIYAFMHDEGLSCYYGTNSHHFDPDKKQYWDAKEDMPDYARLSTDVLAHWRRYGFRGEAFKCGNSYDFINAAKAVR
jgi:hypothetical protein